jgi:transposase InsO family protein
MVAQWEARISAQRQRSRANHAEFVICDHTIDITYLPTEEGWLYLAGVIDLFSRKFVGWAMAETMTTELVVQALQMALHTRKPEADLLHHSDRGTQYASHDYRALLKTHHIAVSMSPGALWAWELL